ncbi:hypothetical protein [Nesterenkonia halotolerans]|uniref:Uncharacterized protein n=1 Tax=Nesterenkonia halotolerans TaxID=225325 RepID=A0ABR9J685_9MICC|nr:hypothetical protein [Nesterenkonia halotolerans]MBE1514508.1 hypothetical protein [Nesterenkonia halotolerans]
MGHQMRTFGATTVMGALLGGSLLGCTTNLQDPDTPAGVPNYVVEEEAGGPDMALEGQIAELDGCFYIKGPEPEEQLTLAIFPAHEIHETSSGSGFAFRGEAFSDGDGITVGGGEAGPTIYAVPDQCDDEVQQWRVTPSTPAP